jgi:hypothetical protein
MSRGQKPKRIIFQAGAHKLYFHPNRHKLQKMLLYSHVITFVALLMTKKGCTTNAAPFGYGLYFNDTCTDLRDDTFLQGQGNPAAFDTDHCNTWLPSDGTTNSLKVSSCSSKCVCVVQSPDSPSCSADDAQKVVVEICVNECRQDDQGNSLMLASDFGGCGEGKEVADDDYSCACNGMKDNSLCGGMSSVGAPSPGSAPSPGVAPSPDATPTDGDPADTAITLMTSSISLLLAIQAVYFVF